VSTVKIPRAQRTRGGSGSGCILMSDVPKRFLFPCVAGRSPRSSLVINLSVHDLLMHGLMALPVELLARLVAVPGSFARAL
jgi:hypothetical protein